MGGPKSWRTKKLNSIRSLMNQTTWGTNKIQEAERGRKLNIHIQLDKNILIKLGGCQSTKFALLMFIKMLKFTRFLRGPNGPKICARRIKTDFYGPGLFFHFFCVEKCPSVVSSELERYLITPKYPQMASCLV